MIDHIRKNKRIVLKEEFSSAEGGSGKMEANPKRLLEEALGKLSETQRSLVMLKDYEGYNYQEIGEITGLKESQVKVYIYRARVSLKEFIGKIENVI